MKNQQKKAFGENLRNLFRTCCIFKKSFLEAFALFALSRAET
jgi:hypothetical protein